MGLALMCNLTRSQDLGTLVGTWSLVGYRDTPEGGTAAEAFGVKPIGYFIFTADGHASINIMRNPPRSSLKTADPDPDTCVPDWYCSYFGTYTIDRLRNVYVVHVLGSNEPAYVGTDQTRPYSIKGDKLIISETYMAGNLRVKAERVLIRVGPNEGAPAK